MKKQVVAMLLTSIFAISMSACGSSGVSQAEYDKVVKERDQYKAQLDALNGKSKDTTEQSDGPDESKSNEFKIGETWEVEGKFKVTVNSVVETADRNQFAETNPAAVYIITYTYENLGIPDELYVNMEDKIVDNAGKMGSSYPGDIEKHAQAVPTGAYCEAQACIEVENAGSFKDYVSIYDDNYNEYNAVFNLDIQ